MNQEELRRHLEKLADSLNSESKDALYSRLQSLSSAFPFNEYEYILMFLRDREAISFENYEQLRRNYVQQNRNLNLYGLAPRIFGQIWGEQHITDLDSRFVKPNKSLDPQYDGQYDLLADGVRVEVKAARAIDTKIRGDLVSKALKRDSTRPFWMNFQQLKVDTCDVFLFIGVWIDVIEYWVLSPADIQSNPYLSHQHRGGVEYQIGVNQKNLAEFKKFSCPAMELFDRVRSKGISK